MEFGICGGDDKISYVVGGGYTYMERRVDEYLCPLKGEQEFKQTFQQTNTSLPTPYLNCFLPGELHVTGPDVNTIELENYCSTLFSRAAECRVEMVVLGSGGQRRIPEDFSRSIAFKQLKDFAVVAERYARKNDIIIVLEPLNSQETNVFNTLQESAEFVRKLDLPNFKLLADLYHMMMEDEDPQSIIDNVDIICHMHIATAPNRLIPGSEVCDLPKFLAAVKKSGYDGALSIEAQIEPSAYKLESAMKYMKKYL
jgi:sugar phosphate isomerase/epimerase